MAAVPTNAALQAQLAEHAEALDTIWMLLGACLVFFMHAGFSLLEAGCVRFKNTQNILAKNLIVVTIGFLCWYFIGYGLALGAADPDNAGKFAGSAGFTTAGFMDDTASKSQYRVWFFQGAFCATAGTIVSGSMAERTQLKGFAIYVVLLTAIIYPIVIYWGWSGYGILWYTDADSGEDVSIVGPWYRDFAGSGLVHMVGGVGALCGATIVGPRKGRFVASVDQNDFTAHSIPFVVLGTFCLWFGWYGFNPGSTLEMHSTAKANQAGLVATNTTLSPSICGLIVFLLRAKVTQDYLDVGGFCNGLLAGLVSITAGCGFVMPWEAIIIGIIGAFVYEGTSKLIQKAKIDDVVDAFAVHGACGMWGVIAVGLFGNPEDGQDGNGVFYGGDQLGTQIVAILLIAVWVAALSIAILLPLRLVGFLTLDADFQDKGADLMEHSPVKDYGNAPLKEV